MPRACSVGRLVASYGCLSMVGVDVISMVEGVGLVLFAPPATSLPTNQALLSYLGLAGVTAHMRANGTSGSNSMF